MDHPYRSQPAKAYWKETVTPYHPQDVPDWYEKRFSLEGARIATAGSCFAQQLGRNLRESGFRYLDVEPAPEGLPVALHRDYGYALYSARYGNVYTTRQLIQLIQRALGQFTPTETHWEKDGGVVDPFRPTIEPEPYGSVAELQVLQRDHLEHVVEMFHEQDVFVFTMGMTEAWLSRHDGAAFPLCPGTAGGVYDDTKYRFHNLNSVEVRADMEASIAALRAINPKLKILLTVSPVAIMATATDQQVAVANAYSKSLLRTVAGELYDAHDFIDYFPSYEMITAPFMKGYFLAPTQREVAPAGVAFVMAQFMAQHQPPTAMRRAEGPAATPAPRPLPTRRAPPAPRQDAGDLALDDVKCDEEILAAFGPPKD
ncbi:GSCFA domain-containing protein [Pararhodobacter sp.]|uniref:GSCFA domain-containing protein n=1 Tax=Pararhodobacter sp. TaxID=2127056 RepID=UPI002AFF9F62|nr:GSCFA domain-containing protein [Pararhodobacter sp.]